VFSDNYIPDLSAAARDQYGKSSWFCHFIGELIGEWDVAGINNVNDLWPDHRLPSFYRYSDPEAGSWHFDCHGDKDFVLMWCNMRTTEFREKQRHNAPVFKLPVNRVCILNNQLLEHRRPQLSKTAKSRRHFMVARPTNGGGVFKDTTGNHIKAPDTVRRLK
jgi:hypothetical protein